MHEQDQIHETYRIMEQLCNVVRSCSEANELRSLITLKSRCGQFKRNIDSKKIQLEEKYKYLQEKINNLSSQSISLQSTLENEQLNTRTIQSQLEKQRS